MKGKKEWWWVVMTCLLWAGVLRAETIDGSRNPELISDDVAFGQLAWIVYLSPKATDEDRGFTAAFSEHYGITAGDLSGLQALAEQLTEINDRAGKAPSAEEANSISAEGADKTHAARTGASAKLLGILPEIKAGTTIQEGQ